MLNMVKDFFDKMGKYGSQRKTGGGTPPPQSSNPESALLKRERSHSFSETEGLVAYSQDKKDLLDFSFLSNRSILPNLNQCVIDWLRNSEIIYINSAPLKTLLEKRGLVTTNIAGETVLKEGKTPEDLESGITLIWKEQILNHFDEDLRNVVSDHLLKYMNQNGYLGALQKSFFAAAFLNGVKLKNFTKQKWDIVSVPNGFSIVEVFSLQSVASERGLEEDVLTKASYNDQQREWRLVKKDGSELMKGQALYVIQFNPVNKDFKIAIGDAIFYYYCKYAENLCWELKTKEKQPEEVIESSEHKPSLNSP
jgi:hypothetical protein